MTELWWVEPAAEAWLRARGLLTLDGVAAAAAAGTRLSSDRQSAAVRTADDPPLLLKWRRVRRGRRLRTWLRPSRERREARAMLAALARGIPGPRPLAVGERRRGGVLVAAALVRPYVEGMTPASERASTTERVAAALRRWHTAGFRHGNAYPKNVLLGDDGRSAMPIGFSGARFVEPGPRWDRAAAKDLAQLAAGSAVPDLPAIVATYAREPGLPPEDVLLRTVTPLFERVLAKKAARLASRPAREPGGAPLPDPIPPASDLRVAAPLPISRLAPGA